MEFFNHCCFCINLRTGSILMSCIVMLLSISNLSISILELMINKHAPYSTSMIIVTNFSVLCSVMFILRYAFKNKRYSWHVSLCMFVMVLAQVLDTVIILTEGSSWKFLYFILLNSFLNSCSLYYFMLVVMSYFYNMSEGNTFDSS